jgi:predicted secreted protein
VRVTSEQITGVWKRTVKLYLDYQQVIVDEIPIDDDELSRSRIIDRL